MTPKFTRLGAALAVMLMLTACGASTGGSGGNAEKGSGASTPALPPPRKLLGVSAPISYDDQQAIALAKKVDTGPGYRDIISNMLYPALLRRFSGAVIGDLHLTIVFTGEAKQAVRITNIEVTSVRASRKALSGTYLPVAHQGGRPAYEFMVDMDQNLPHLVRAKGGQSFPDFNIQLSSGEQSAVGVDFTASRGAFTWLLTVTYLVGGHRYQTVVRAAKNRPFTVTARAKKYGAFYVNDVYSGLHLQQQK